ncbi:MAG: hypothetical protein HKN79_02050, partial [Flavobacteriales bacterium]|nr:hypothetical protein [Flavobacteriales bacterium]
PGAVIRTYFRPAIWEMGGALQALAAIENSLYILLLLSAIIWRKGIQNQDLFIMCLIFLVAMGVLIGSVTPVLGAIVRYKVPALPFLMMLIYLIADTKRLSS